MAETTAAQEASAHVSAYTVAWLRYQKDGSGADALTRLHCELCDLVADGLRYRRAALAAVEHGEGRDG